MADGKFTRMLAASCALLVLALTTQVTGVRVLTCDSDGTTTAEEDSLDFLLVCDALDMTESITWLVQQRLRPPGVNTSDIISTCSRSNDILPSYLSLWQCRADYSVLIRAGINEYNKRSHMILPNVGRGGLADGNWSCHNGGGVSAECAVDVVHTPKNVSCQVTVDEAHGLVSGECQTSKMFSSLDRYTCKWFERNDNGVEAEIPAAQTALTLTNCSEGYLDYYCGSCNFSKTLPVPKASYGYRVVIFPGKVSPAIDYTFVANENPNSYTSSGTTNNGVTSPVPTPSSSVATVTPNNGVTSSAPASGSSGSAGSNAVTSQTLTTSSRATSHKGGGTKNNGLLEGIGIEAGAIIGLLFVAILLFLVIRRSRDHKKREPQVPFSNGEYDHPEPRESIKKSHNKDCESDVPSTRSSHYDDDEDSGYSVIGSKGYTDAMSDKGDALATSINSTFRNTTEEGISTRGLPEVPAKTNTDEASTRNDVTETVGDPRGVEKRAARRMELEQKNDNEAIEMKLAPVILPSGFQMKDADYMYWRNEGIPLSEPV